MQERIITDGRGSIQPIKRANTAFANAGEQVPETPIALLSGGRQSGISSDSKIRSEEEARGEALKNLSEGKDKSDGKTHIDVIIKDTGEDGSKKGGKAKQGEKGNVKKVEVSLDDKTVEKIGNEINKKGNKRRRNIEKAREMIENGTNDTNHVQTNDSNKNPSEKQQGDAKVDGTVRTIDGETIKRNINSKDDE